MRDPMLDPRNVLASGQEPIRGDSGPILKGARDLPLPVGLVPIGDVLPDVGRDLSRRRIEARLRLVVETCDQALASPDLDDSTRRLVEAIRDQAMGGGT